VASIAEPEAPPELYRRAKEADLGQFLRDPAALAGWMHFNDVGEFDWLTFKAKHIKHAVDLIGPGERIASVERLEDWLSILREHWTERTLARALDLAKGMPPQQALDHLQSVTEEIRETSQQANAPPPFVDLGPFLAGSVGPERPTIGEIEGGGHLLYAGRLNEIHAEPSVGKTNIALAIAIDVLRSGQAVLFIDPEDTPQGIATRLISFGADPATVVANFHYLQNPDPVDLHRTAAWSARAKPALTIIDGLAELLAGSAVDENDAGAILQFFKAHIRPFAEAGSAVLISDHVAKDTEGRGRWARGSGAKLGRYDGAVYTATTVQAYAPTQAGSVRLTISKDRNGGVGPRGHHTAHIHFEPLQEEEPGTLVTIRQAPVDWKPTHLMDRVVQELQTNPEATARDLRSLGKSDYVDTAIRALVEEGKLRIEKQGPGKPNRYILP
jgi:hypothetical protein